MRKRRNNTKYSMKRKDDAECEFEANNVHIGWYPHTREELLECGLINTSMLSKAKKSDNGIDVPPGYRDDNGTDVSYVKDIDPKFHQGNKITCAWSATSILIDLLCSDTADEMIRLRDADPNKYSNIHLFKYSQEYGSVATNLSQHSDYELRKVKKIGRMKDRIDNIMKKDEGLFVCVLADYNGSTNHCIGINCETHLIYDAVDLKAKSLTKENIEYSTGLYENDVSAGIAGFLDVAEIVKKRGK